MPENLQLLLLVTVSWLWSVLDALEKEIYILHTKGIFVCIQGINGIESVLSCILESNNMFAILSYTCILLQSKVYLHTNMRTYQLFLHAQENNIQRKCTVNVEQDTW